MKLIFVHGINQEGGSSEALRQNWLTALRAGAARSEAWPEGQLSGLEVPFYGDRLFELTEGKAPWTTVAQGVQEASDDFCEFAYDAVAQMAVKAGATQADFEKELGLKTPMGKGAHKKMLKAAARMLEEYAPLLARDAIKTLKQAHAYLTREHIADEVNRIVRPCLESDEEMVVISHSLGTIVAYALLREFAAMGRPRMCRLFMTLGSPLAIDEVRKKFPLPRNIPKDVACWFNGADPEDFVALHDVLGPPRYSSGIVNVTDIDNGYDDPHDILQYLRNQHVGRAALESLGG